MISSDGRYVLFVSSARNLAPPGSNEPPPVLHPLPLNVFLRDRVNATTRLVSIGSAGNAADGDSFPSAISADGRYALFESRAGNLAPGDDNGTDDVFRRDLNLQTTMLISVATTGKSGNGASRQSVMTPNGRYVAFVSSASNLVIGDTNALPDVFVRDLSSSMTTLVSTGAVPGATVNGPDGSQAPEITPDGRFVAFFSSATNLVPGVRSSGEVYVRDLLAGTTTWVSTNARSLSLSVVGSTNFFSCNHRISDDGRFVAFEARTNFATATSARGLILRHDLQTGTTAIVHTNGNVPLLSITSMRNLAMTSDGRFIAFVANENGSAGTTTAIYLWDSQTDVNTLVSGDTNNVVPTNSICDSPVVSEDGNRVAFVSNAPGLTTNALAAGYHLYVRDLQTGITRFVDTADGPDLESTAAPAMSGDGRFIAFDSTNDNLVPNDSNRSSDVFVRDLATDAIESVSVRDPALVSVTPAGRIGVSSFSVSANGRYVAFDSDAGDMTDGDTNGFRNVFVRDVILGTNILVSSAPGGGPASGPSYQPAISGDGRFVAFTSWATNLADGDANNRPDVFIRDLENGTTMLVSVSTNGVGDGNGDSYLPTLNVDGRFVLFQSKARNLAPEILSTTLGGVFLRDQQSGITHELAGTVGNSVPPDAMMTPDGRFVALAGLLAQSSPGVGVWDSQSAALIYSNAVTASRVAISPDGLRLAYVTNSSTLNAADVGAGTNWVIASGPIVAFDGNPRLRFSGDGRFLAYSMITPDSIANTNAFPSVFLYDFQTGANVLVSRSFDHPGVPDDASDSPDISADGRYVAYRASASDSIPGDLNDAPDVLLYDRLSAATILVSANQSGNSTVNNRSLSPIFSGDGRTLFFASWASDLSVGDFNNAEDLFALSLVPPMVADSDGDGMDDQWELDHFGTLARDGTGDLDGDGATDLYEFQTGTDPNSATSVFRVEIVSSPTPGESPVLTWPLAIGKSYRVQFKDDLNDPDWLELNGSVVFVGDRGYVTDLDSVPVQRFFRILMNN